MMPRIVVVGSANTDMVVQVSRLPQPGETVMGTDYLQARGGKGANQAVAAARLGAEVTFVARLGQDLLGEEALMGYKAEGIQTQYIVMDAKTPSGVALIMVAQDGENVIAVAPGANANLSPADIQGAEAAIRNAQCLLVQLEIPLAAVGEAINLAAKWQVPVILNPAPAATVSAEILSRVDYLTPNQTEVAMLAGGYGAGQAQAAAFLLAKKTNCKNIIVTLGAEGALIAGFHNRLIPGFTIEPVDTTGAGDAFNGGLAVALARGDDLPAAVQFANAVAAISATRFGAQPSLPSLAEVQDFLRRRAPQLPAS